MFRSVPGERPLPAATSFHYCPRVPLCVKKSGHFRLVNAAKPAAPDRSDGLLGRVAAVAPQIRWNLGLVRRLVGMFDRLFHLVPRRDQRRHHTRSQ